MDAFEAIFTRRSNGSVRPNPIPRELIERLLAAAVQAPNHHKVRPWRFIVLQDEALNRLGDVFAEILKSQYPDLPDSALDKERAKALRAPLIVVVAADLPEDTRVIEVENVCAAAAAAENLLLAAHALGLAVKWRTGSAAFEPRVKEFLGLQPGQPLLGFLYIGFPDERETSLAERPSYEDRVVWME